MKYHQLFFSFSTSKIALNLLITAFLCISLCAGNATTRCTETDKQALLNLKDGFVDERNNLSSWNDKVDCCKWKGISCSNLTGHVTELDLSGLELQGKIYSSLCELQHLISLDLSFNQFKAQNIPKCVGSLSQLRVLGLKFSDLVGIIPRELGNLSNLRALELWGHDLFANDLEWISHLSPLRYLDLSFVNLSRASDWPLSISKLSSLSELYFQDCGLANVKTNFFSHMNTSTSLKILSLQDNNLNSSIMPWVFNVSKVLTHLDLMANSFQGPIPDAFETMTSLEVVFFQFNHFEGGIPKSFRNLCQLKVLYLHSNKLSGQVSDSIQQLCSAQSGIRIITLRDNPFSCGTFPNLTRFSSLQSLDLSNTSLCGLLPQSLGHLPHLYDLTLSHNNLSGPLPEFTDLPILTYLDLSYNQLNGSLPYSMGQLSNLMRLDLYSNNLNGQINEAHLPNLSGLQSLDLSHNPLSFNLSLNWVPPFQLQELYLSSCSLGPDFPAWHKILWPVKFLDISNCGISNSIPTWFWDLTPCLSYMNLSRNNIQGPFPKSSEKKKTECSSSSFIWDLSFNNLSGPLPQFPTNLTTLLLSNNMLLGSVSSFCATPKSRLEYLDLSNNLLSGKLPNCLGNLQNLEVLNLAKNNFSGRIPKTIGTLQQIVSIHLNDNNLSGEIPALMQCRDLKSIDFGENNLHGELPSWIGYNLTDLIVLRLKANRFKGSIPTNLCNLSYLQILDLSQNNFTEQILQCLNKIKAMSRTFPRKIISYEFNIYDHSGDYHEYPDLMEKSILMWKGQEREYWKNLGLMTLVDLSSNQLKGEIPQSITRLLGLASLNLSRNNLTGFLPSDIGQMQKLESLDLSSNYLSGTIPASFSNLSFLSYLNLSFNNLSGRIPLTTQLQTFNASSYIGNQGLCGPPLEDCPGDESSPTPPSNGSTKTNDTEGEHKFTSFGFYVSIALGFITGFWAVCGSLVLKSSWRKAYFQFANNMCDWIYVQVVLFITRMKTKFQN